MLYFGITENSVVALAIFALAFPERFQSLVQDGRRKFRVIPKHIVSYGPDRVGKSNKFGVLRSFNNYRNSSVELLFRDEEPHSQLHCLSICVVNKSVHEHCFAVCTAEINLLLSAAHEDPVRNQDVYVVRACIYTVRLVPPSIVAFFPPTSRILALLALHLRWELFYPFSW